MLASSGTLYVLTSNYFGICARVLESGCGNRDFRCDLQQMQQWSSGCCQVTSGGDVFVSLVKSRYWILVSERKSIGGEWCDEYRIWKRDRELYCQFTAIQWPEPAELGYERSSGQYQAVTERWWSWNAGLLLHKIELRSPMTTNIVGIVAQVMSYFTPLLTGPTVFRFFNRVCTASHSRTRAGPIPYQSPCFVYGLSLAGYHLVSSSIIARTGSWVPS
jgi:hypothetical protein